MATLYADLMIGLTVIDIPEDGVKITEEDLIDRFRRGFRLACRAKRLAVRVIDDEDC